jgi:hypothetical protein
LLFVWHVVENGMGLFFVLLGLFIIGVGALIAYRHAQIWDEERRIRRESVFDV